MRKLKRPHEGMADPGEAAAASFLAVGECPSPIARRKDPKVCVYCGGREYVYNGAVDGDRGSRICVECGAVADEPIFWETRFGRSVPLKGSNYKRIHHWHERISQFMLQETSIPPDRMLEIGRRLLDGSHSSINKDSIRAVLRSLNYQTYIEKWMQIAFAVLGLPPPYFSQQLIWRMDEVFQSLQEPFTAAKPDGRTNFLNYNYTFCRIFQLLGTPQYSMFFPLIKSPSKLRELDAVWFTMCGHLGLEKQTLAPVEPFSVPLHGAGPLLAALELRLGRESQTDSRKEHKQTASLRRDLAGFSARQPQWQLPPRSVPPEAWSLRPTWQAPHQPSMGA